MAKNIFLAPFLNADAIEAGVDEAGRGSLAGPVFAAAVILSPDTLIVGLNDSKQLSAQRRAALRVTIEHKAVAFGVGVATVEEIDALNISNAGYLAMHRAIVRLTKVPTHLLIDGKFFKNPTQLLHTCIIKGDGKFASIAAASILAKTYRDEYMTHLAEQFPEYLWHINKGYGTATHRERMKKYGICVWHRKSFKLK